MHPTALCGEEPRVQQHRTKQLSIFVLPGPSESLAFRPQGPPNGGPHLTQTLKRKSNPVPYGDTAPEAPGGFVVRSLANKVMRRKVFG